MTRSELTAWAAALRSGQYVQGTKHLCVTVEGQDTYCCLGVLGVLRGVPVSGAYLGCHDLSLSRMPIPPPPPLLQGGWLATQRPRTFQHAAALLNDAYSYTFPQIADWLEAQVLPLLPEEVPAHG